MNEDKRTDEARTERELTLQRHGLSVCCPESRLAYLVCWAGAVAERLAGEAGKAGRQVGQVAGGPEQQRGDAGRQAGELPGWAAGAGPELED